MVKLVTVATHSDGYLPWLEKSCKRFNIQLIKLGYGQKWLGFSWRFKLMIEYLKTIDPNELVIFIDAYDVIMLRPLDHIEEYYNNIVKMNKCKIIISEDKGIPFYQDMLGKIYFKDYKGARINAGSYLGKASDILEILNNINQNIFDNDDDDQILLTEYYKKNLGDFYIDTSNIFFVTRVNQLKDILTDENIKIKNKKLTYINTKPFFIHGNGHTYLHNLILKLGYKISNKQINNIISKYKKKVYEINKYYVKIFIKKYIFSLNKYNILFLIILFLFMFIYLKNRFQNELKSLFK
jgi:hypothetical protein